MKISLILARSINNVIGTSENNIPWHLPADFRQFKEKTTGHHLIMGRKTFDSLPGVLPNRPHHVISHSKHKNPSLEVIHYLSIEDCLNEIDRATLPDEEVFMIGGANLTEQFLRKGLIDKVYLTEVDVYEVSTKEEPAVFFYHDFKNDPTFKQTGLQFFHRDEKNRYNFSLKTYERREDK